MRSYAKKLGKTAATKTARTADEADEIALTDAGSNPMANHSMPPPLGFDGTRQRSNSGYRAGDLLRQDDPLSLVQPDATSGLEASAMSSGGNANQFAGFSDAWLTAQNFQDMSIYNPNYMIGSEVTHEFNLLNDFLHNNLLNESGAALGDPQNPGIARAGAASSLDMIPNFANSHGIHAGEPIPAGHLPRGFTLQPTPGPVGSKVPGRVSDKDKTREYYLQAADPSGNDNPEERMSRVLRAKYEAGLLKPFNYINGYARLGKYLDGHIAPSSKQKILRTINQFRPKFREKAQGLTDMQLVYVEMWFEKQLMDYDRVFASMAVPACCWRRTGEIFRGNKEMAELINVPVDQLRDGKIALHEILTEESMVRYWEEFGTIAFDPSHDTLLTACSLKNPSDSSDHPIVKSCFSFTIRRDEHKL
ncbi:Regulator of drug sensitivity 2 [Escovopsis weberi]|uniref:Regulator of drug sensitivity 2 n=1 Tax=Escovopsis weberi TaxID=150374 RepID=A0A0M8MZD5_ESCWE|nr:Regulator of drug sensitivity 2 [Escovopsis weberi]